MDRRRSSNRFLPPGTQRIETTSGTEVGWSPIPSSDPEQPLNWPRWRKTLHVAILSWYTTISYAAQTSATPLWVNIEFDTGVSVDTLTTAYACNSAALGVGCILFVPLAMKFGRRSVYIIASLLITLSMFWQGRARTPAAFIGSNILSGLAGAVAEALFQVTVDDLFFVHQRASANGLYVACMSIGTYLGPVVAGYVAVMQSWEWMFYYLAIAMGLATLTMIFALEESKFIEPVVLGQPVDSPRIATEEDPLLPKGEAGVVKKTSADRLPSLTPSTSEAKLDAFPIVQSSSPPSYWHRLRLYTLDPYTTSESNTFLLHIVQPFQILVSFPAIAFAALQYGYLVSLLSIVAVTQATMYPKPPYNFETVDVGLMSVPPAIGAVLGSVFGGPVVDKFTLYIAKSRSGIHEPETRLWLFFLPSLGGVAGLLIYGLTIAEGVAWPVNAFGAGLTGFAVGACGDMALTYVQDSYEHILGDALVGVSFVRNAIATVMVWAVPRFIELWGVYYMFVVMGCLAALSTISAVPMVIWGRTWRAKFALKYWEFTDRQY